MSPQNHQKCDLMFTLPKSDILHFNQSQVQNRHKGHRTKCQMTFPHVLRRDNTWGTPPKVHKSTVVGVILSEEMRRKSTGETSGNALNMESRGRQKDR
jgi:hypothetical protein